MARRAKKKMGTITVTAPRGVKVNIKRRKAPKRRKAAGRKVAKRGRRKTPKRGPDGLFVSSKKKKGRGRRKTTTPKRAKRSRRKAKSTKRKTAKRGRRVSKRKRRPGLLGTLDSLSPRGALAAAAAIGNVIRNDSKMANSKRRKRRI